MHKLEWFDCKVPGTVAVLNDNGFVLRLIFPTPGPRNHDPLFQHARKLDDWRSVLTLLQRREFWKDWQWGFNGLDAPEEIPAGACAYFAASEEAYGAFQLTAKREGDE